MFKTAVNESMTITVDFSADIGDKCPMKREVEGSNFASFTFGDGPESVDLSFTAEGLRAFLLLCKESMHELDMAYAREEARRSQRSQANATEPELATAGERAE